MIFGPPIQEHSDSTQLDQPIQQPARTRLHNSSFAFAGITHLHGSSGIFVFSINAFHIGNSNNIRTK